MRRGFFGKKIISYKGSLNPVTDVDRRAEKKIISIIHKKFPDHTFMAEESAFLNKGDLGRARRGRYRWVIDPVDGTVNFIHQIPHSGV